MESGKGIRKSVLIVCIMLICLACGSNVYAATVARIGSKSYSSLQSAVNAAKNGQTIKVTKAISAKKKVTVSGKKSITIDFCNKKYSMTQNDYGFDVTATKLTVKNIKYHSVTGAFLIGKNSTVVVNNGTVIGQTYNKGKYILKKGSFEGNGCEVDEDSTNSPALKNLGYFEAHNPSFTGTGRDAIWNFGRAIIYGGTFSTKKSDCIYNASDGVMTINGGTFNHTIKDGYSYLMANYGDLVINKGTFKGTMLNYSKKRFLINDGVFRSTPTYFVLRNIEGNTTITGGSFSTTSANTIYNNSGAKLTITGGRFETRSEEGYFALFSEGSITVTGGTFKMNDKTQNSIGVKNNSEWYVGSKVNGTVEVKY